MMLHTFFAVMSPEANARAVAIEISASLINDGICEGCIASAAAY
jgi:hypothetical protein